LISHKFALIVRRIVLSGIIFLQIASVAQSTSAQQVPNADATVAAIMDEILKRGEGQVGDIKTYTWVPPSSQEIQRIKDIGHDAIAPLSKVLESPTRRSFQQTLAVKLLGEIGGADIIPPLEQALQHDKPNSVRIAALVALLNVPDEAALPIIRNAFHDSDAAVAQRAKDLLTDYYHLPVPQ